MTIYLDAVWLLNFFIDWMILMLTHSFAKATNHRFRVMVGAIVASLLVPLHVLFPDALWSTPPGKLIFSVFIVLAAFGYKNIRLFARQLFLFYFISFAIGGGLFGIYYMLNDAIHVSTGMIVTYQSGFGDGVSWLFVFIGFPLVWLFTKKRLDKLVVQQLKYDEMVPLSICFHNRVHDTTAFIDSGNQLTDPITKQPVVICDEVFMRQWFTEEEWQLLYKAQDELNFDVLPEKWQDRCRIVPYQGVSGDRAFMMVLKPDWLQVTVNGNHLTISRVLVGIQFGSLSPDESYHCLMHPHLLKDVAVDSA